MNPYNVFGTSKDLESGAGVVLQYPGFSIKIHRAGGSNRKFAQVLSAKMKPYRQRFERGLLDEETSENILLETYVEAVVLGWEGVTDVNGDEIPFSHENCLHLFKDLPDLYADVKEQASKASTFAAATLGIEEKN